MTLARRSTASAANAAVSRRWPPVLATALVWGVLALSAGYWGLRWWGETPTRPLPPPPAAALNIDSGRVAAALGARAAVAASPTNPPVAALASRLQLVGVVADRDGRGTALIALDGQPPRPYRVGAVLTEGVRLVHVGPRHAEVGGDAGQVRLALPDKPAAAAPASARPVPGLVRP